MPGCCDNAAMAAAREIWQQIGEVIETYPLAAYVILIAVTFLLCPLLRLVVGRAALRLAIHTRVITDDLVIDALRPFRFVYILPVALGYILAPMAEPYASEARTVFGLLALVLIVDTIIKVLSGIGAVARQRLEGTRVNTEAYVDLLKIATIVLAVVIAVAFTTETEPWKLLSGVGAFAALLIFIFKDTLLSVIASLQIESWGHIREGDWISVPSSDADGTVERIGLFDITVKNWDLSTSCIPTHTILRADFKNYRSMSDSRARRIKRALNLDLHSIKFSDRKLLQKLKRIDLISDLVEEKLKELDTSNEMSPNRATNLDLFRAYVVSYLQTRDDIHQKRMFILVRDLAPGPHGLPLEIWAFSRDTDWAEYEAVQASIFSHLIVMLDEFDLRLYQSLAEVTTANHDSVKRSA